MDIEQLKTEQEALMKILEANRDLPPPRGSVARRRTMRDVHQLYIQNIEEALLAITVLIQYISMIT